jgi:DNA repair exonuclease SbcCD ATPase subunit
VDDRSNYPVHGWIEGYDLLLFGDIHVQQIHRYKENLKTHEFTSTDKKPLYKTGAYRFATNEQAPWSYAGSLIQQNFGENLWGHGFTEWDLDTKTATFYHVPNNFGYVAVMQKDEQFCVKLRMERSVLCVPLQKIVRLGWFPKRIALRISTNLRAHLQDIQQQIQEAGIHIQDSGFLEESALDIDTPNAGSEPKPLETDLSSLNSADTWVNYFMETIQMQPGDWTQWIHHPHLLQVPDGVYSPTSLDKIKDRNRALHKLVESFLHTKDVKAPVRRFRIHAIEFSWLLCYGESNWMNFDTFQKQICQISGQNGSGKSAFLEVLCIALYGESFPSRTSASYSASILNQQREKGKQPHTNICFSVDDTKYWIHRSFDTQQKNPKNLLQRNVHLLRDDTREAVKQTVTHVDAWVHQHIGQFHHFLLTTIMSQGNDSDFFQMTPKAQKTIIDSLLQLNVCEEFRAILKEAKLGHAYALTQLQTYEDGIRQGMQFQLPQDASVIADLQQRKREWDIVLQHIHTERTRLKQSFVSIAEKEFHTPHNVLQDRLASIQIVPILDNLEDVRRRQSTARDRMAVLKAKPFRPTASSGNPATTFDEAERALQAVKQERIPYGKVQPYDADRHAVWSKQPVPLAPPAQTTGDETLAEVERQWAKLQAEHATYEVPEDGDITPLDAEALRTLRAQDERIQAKLQGIDEEIRLNTRERAQLEAMLPPAVRNKLTAYEQARKALESTFAPPKEAKERIDQATNLTQQLAVLHKELASTERQLIEVGAVSYNPKCPDCAKNPFRHKKEALLGEQRRIAEEIAQAEAERTRIGKGLPLTHIVELYHAWNTLHSDKLVQQKDQHATLQQRIEEGTQLAKTRKQLEQDREDLGYETQEILADYHALCQSMQALTTRRTYLRYQQEKAEWDKARTVHDLDLRITQHEQVATQAFTHEYKQTQTELLDTTAILDQHEANQRNLALQESITAICEAYPSWVQYKELEAEQAKLAKDYSQCEAQLEQALLLHTRQEESRCLLDKLQAFLRQMEARTNCVTQLYNGFETYTNWLYPKKVGPVIETAVNTVLQAIALPRPIRLQAQWDTDHFHWIVVDGLSTPPYEKCSGAQRFFVSLALRFAFSRMGTSNMINAQMFLDEGFTACDVETIDRVPSLLRNILHTQDLQTIFLVSHLDTLKSAASQTITIQRRMNNSSIQTGEKPKMPKKST